MTRTPIISTPARPAGRRGFAFLLVLTLLIVASIMLAVGLTRGVTQSLAVQRQIDSYQRHHELLGVLDIVTDWITKNNLRLRQYAYTGGVAYRYVLGPSHLVEIRVSEAQGTLLSRIDRVRDREQREWLLAALGRLPPNHPEFLRSKGPPEVSVITASDEVLRAISGDSQDLYDGLKAAREARTTDTAQFMSHLTRAGVVSPKIQQMIRFVALNPQLFRIEAVVLQDGDRRDYEILTSVVGSLPPAFFDIRAVPRGRRSIEDLDDADSIDAAPLTVFP